MTRAKISSAKWTTVLITILSWIAISNHCALAAIAAPSSSSAAADEQCPMHSPHTPAKQNDGGEMPCCKILRVVAPSPAKTFAQKIVNLDYVDLVFTPLVVLASPKFFFTAVALDTGPPGTTSFVELIGSVRAHAPPPLA
ncbi:MAG: hypothetical protein QOI04_1375 [Verrucomicrobiota bacterium]|jgi:hypothetical protein